MNTHHCWAQDSFFYHIYPLGFCGAPQHNDFTSSPVPRLESIRGWLDHLQYLGVNALYLGPLFESSAHGYDTADYFQVDRRLGDHQTLAHLVNEIHNRGMHIILDGVFNHVGRHFWAFRDVQEKGQQSAYKDWFTRLDFSSHSPFGDPFSYEGWENHFDLVKLNLQNPTVTAHLFKAVEMWVQEFDIDGLRLDVAYSLDKAFLHNLSAHCHALKPDFWLLGEIIHGNYTKWVNSKALDSATNYECYKGLYSSHVDKNFYEIAYAFNRQFGESGIYRGLPLYNFADNHDVDRVASKLDNPAHLTTLYALLFTMPGIPSIYYGSEFGIAGKKTNGSDTALRPCLELRQLQTNCPQPRLPAWIARLAQVRRHTPALRYGNYRQLYVSHQQLAFLRRFEKDIAIVVTNAAPEAVDVSFPNPLDPGIGLRDLLQESEVSSIGSSTLTVSMLPNSASILNSSYP